MGLLCFFGCSRGLRRSNPLSLFLFSLVADVFSALMAKVASGSVIEGLISRSDGFSISHL